MHQAKRTLTLLEQLGTEKSKLVELLHPGRVSLEVGPDFASQPQGQLVISATLNILSRLYPVVQDLEIVIPSDVPLRASVPRWHHISLVGHLEYMMQAIDPPLAWRFTTSPSANTREVVVSFGESSSRAERVIFLGSDGWVASLSPFGPLGVGEAENSIGAYATACLGASEVWKNLLYIHRDILPGVPIVPMREPISFSTFTYNAGVASINPSLPSTLDIGRLTMVGVGAGGGAAAFTLASLRGFVGAVTLVDPDVIVPSNLNRYVYADAGDAAAGLGKANLVGTLLEALPSVSAKALAMSFDQARQQLEVEDYRYVVATVDTREARRQIQYETPQVLWDAGATDTGEFLLWRLVLGHTECMMCKHPLDADPEHAKAKQLTALLGLDSPTWLRKLRDNELFSETEAITIADFIKGSDMSLDLPQPGERYNDWMANQCGRMTLPDRDESIPVPFSPIMAGVLLAGEVIKEHAFLEAVLDSYYWNSLVGQFMIRVKPQRRPPKPSCRFCAEHAFLDQYERRWGKPVPRKPQ